MTRRRSFRCRTMSNPATSARRESGDSRVVRIRTMVVLPAPLGPSSANTLPRCTLRFTAASTVTLRNDFVRPSVLIASSDIPVMPLILRNRRLFCVLDTLYYVQDTLNAVHRNARPPPDRTSGHESVILRIATAEAGCQTFLVARSREAPGAPCGSTT